MSASQALNLGYLSASVVNVPTQKSLLLPGTIQSIPSLASPKQLPGLRTSNNSLRKTTSLKTAVAAAESSVPTETQQESSRKRYHFIVANAKFMLDEEEHFQEQLAERLRLFGERGNEQDFWLVIEPKFLDKFPNITKRLKRPAVALVSTNGPWITFMKLRLDRVLQESFEADSLEEALASTPVTLEFEKPERWVAPYPKYEYGWWEPFLPPGSKTASV
ncbi:OLC1v1006504C1 [Oldenlandia corymbosa var. corymbosa]|uniref:OLC1v1006504C1 n=1 Tax=Oldenlandia corymbosa var. corymbosa TaxID=529605 RepID=A0AAV1DH84_OLDCO|nr:OLC1v1006504C1 [Oldenlandia corymbosa var. corymbosa]